MNKQKTKYHFWQMAIKRGEGKCAKCGRKDNLTLDHIIPCSLLDQLCLFDERYNDEDNFQYLCRWCNQQKGKKLDHLNPKTVHLLEKYFTQYKKSI